MGGDIFCRLFVDRASQRLRGQCMLWGRIFWMARRLSLFVFFVVVPVVGVAAWGFLQHIRECLVCVFARGTFSAVSFRFDCDDALRIGCHSRAKNASLRDTSMRRHGERVARRERFVIARRVLALLVRA